MVEMKTKFLIYYGILLLELSFLSQVSGRVTDEHAASSEFSTVLDWMYNGNELALIVSAVSATECRIRCYQNVNCNAFTWSTRCPPSHPNWCYLKSSIGQGGRRQLGDISGYRLKKVSDDTYRNVSNPELDGTTIVADTKGQQHVVSNRYGWSFHNCKHRGPKTGIVLYPTDIKHKNIVLLVCDQHFGYQPNAGTRHDQLLRWYYGIYRESKQYRLVSGFSLKDDESLVFNDWSRNGRGPYTDNINQMDAFEQDVVRRVVTGQLDSYIGS